MLQSRRDLLIQFEKCYNLSGATAGDKVAEEFADLTDEDISALRGAKADGSQTEDYWDKLEKEWKEMATQQGSILVLFQFITQLKASK